MKNQNNVWNNVMAISIKYKPSKITKSEKPQGQTVRLWGRIILQYDIFQLHKQPLGSGKWNTTVHTGHQYFLLVMGLKEQNILIFLCQNTV